MPEHGFGEDTTLNTVGTPGYLSWVHFGDLHIQEEEDENYSDFLDLIEEANENLAGEVDFAFLPGDNAENGTEAEYNLVRRALDRLVLPVHVIAGDHDRKAGTLDYFRRYLEPEPYRAVALQTFRLLFLNAMDGDTQKDFDLSSEQLEWLRQELDEARAAGLRPLLFLHLYPSELRTRAAELNRLVREFRVELVEMGHTHYNELANDGHTIYAVTRSTGQIEEGPPGFSFTTVDGDVISWKFKPRGTWPFVMITSPSDENLITRPESSHHVVRGVVPVRATMWGASAVSAVSYSVDELSPRPMHFAHGHWSVEWDSSEVPDGSHRLAIHAVTEAGRTAQDAISILVNQAGQYKAPLRSAIDYENAIGAYPAKYVLGTQLGPNENGTKGPWPSWRGKL